MLGCEDFKARYDGGGGGGRGIWCCCYVGVYAVCERVPLLAQNAKHAREREREKKVSVVRVREWAREEGVFVERERDTHNAEEKAVLLCSRGVGRV